MNKHSRIIVIVLLAVLLLLAAAIIMFYVDVGKDAGAASDSNAASDGTSDSYAARVFTDESGLCGLEDANGNIILEPEWTELVPIGNGFFKAKLLTRSDSLYGVIDDEGDVIVPFVYDEIEKQSDYIYGARLRDTGEYLFYSGDFSLLLPDAADSYSMEGTFLNIYDGEDEYIYRQGEKLQLVEVIMPRLIRPISFTLTVSDPETLSIMEPSRWGSIADKLLQFLDIYRRGQLTRLEEITEPSCLSNVTEAAKTELSWKGGLADNIYVYKAQYDDTVAVYCDIELLTVNENEDEIEETKSTKLRLAFAESESGEWTLWNAEFTGEE